MQRVRLHGLAWFLLSCQYGRICQRRGLSTSRPRQNGRHFADASFKGIFADESYCIVIQILLKFILKGNMILPLIEVCSQWASYQIRKIAGAHAPGMPGTYFPSPRVSDPDMHHGTCVTHVPWCMPGSLTSGCLWNRRRGKTFPAFPAHAQPAILRIW